MIVAPLAQGAWPGSGSRGRPGWRASKLVVVKRMMNALESDPEHVQMFLAEARLAAQLSHHRVVRIFELGAEGNYYIAMEYLDGEPVSGAPHR